MLPTYAFAAVSPNSIQTNQWYCVVNTFENGVQKLYVDGVLVSQQSLSFTQAKACTNTNFIIGSWWQGDLISFQGKMDEVRFYDRAINQQEVNSLCNQTTSLSCNNWLYTPTVGSTASFGDLDVPGNQITVEATINRTQPYVSFGTDNTEGDVVSKHNSPADVNYLLRPNHAFITTTDGFFSTPDVCDIELNKTYHIALVYDGVTLKFYRNGYLMSQVNASGNLFQNNWNTRVGLNDPAFWKTQFIGFINEVRIWNTAKTQAQLKANMNSALPNPTTQTGLVGYYTFDNLINKQGNTLYNGTLAGSASINQTNPNCTFVADSCSIVNIPGGIINDYTPVLELNTCKNLVTVEDATAFYIGDTVLMIQMKGAVIDTSNTAAFGTITDYKNAGNYEFNYVKSKNGNIIELLDSLTRSYDVPVGKVQLIRVPYYNTAKITATLTCLPWDGSKGGVLVLNVKDSVAMEADIDLTGKGFRGGKSPNSFSLTLNCSENNYIYPAGSIKAAAKGEGIAIINDQIGWGKGAAANGGGSGVGHNSGGGGGSNGGKGGLGGYQLQACGNAPFDNRGMGANNLQYSNTQNKVFMGGGGGAGHVDNAGGSDMDGGNGGGIVIINTGNIKANSFNIISRGGNASQCSAPLYSNCHDGSGGGGGGGAILINAGNYHLAIPLIVAGGKGADLAIFDSAAGAGRIGPGGGGGAGIIWINTPGLPANVTTNLSGGINGVIPADNNNPWGTTPGLTGLSLFNLQIPVGSKAFLKNIDSVKIKDSIISCNQFDFKGVAYTTTSPITQWQWNFGDGNFANTQNTTHTYNSINTFTVWLVVTDINGCKDSTSNIVSATGGINFDFAYKQDICNPLSVQFTNIGVAPSSTYWSFGDGTVVSGNTATTHVYSNPGNYAVKFGISNGTCTDTIVKTISVNILAADIISTRDTTICFNGTKQLNTIPVLSFCWSPTSFLNDALSANPFSSSPGPITYYFTAETPGTNVISNGDFSLGNTGFSSQYNFANPNTTEGEYFVGTNPQAWNGSVSPCTDHTTGTGNMMLVKGSPIINVNVWTQAVAVTPNTNYAFSTWVQALYNPNPAQLSFSINGGTLGSLITASLPTCTWNQFYTTWNSGSNTTATIAIVNKNTFVQGNDFALDDISFSSVLIVRDSVHINIDTPHVKTNADTVLCAGKTVQLNATGAVAYNWISGTGLNNNGIANPIATPTNTTQYIVAGTDGFNCTAKDTVTITINPLPVISKSVDSVICRNDSIQLLASGGTGYSWSPAVSLDNAAIANPIAKPTSNTTYLVTVTGANSCTKTDSVKIAIRPIPVFTISPNQAICTGNTTQLTAGGGNLYLWSPAALVNNANSSSPSTNTNTTITTTFTVKIKDNTCNDSTSLTTTVVINPLPAVNAAKLNDIDCVFSAAQLSASGANRYIWSPATGLNNANIPNPLATITSRQQYLVTGTDTLTNCSGKDTITVFIKGPFDPTFFVPNAFSPNGDGINDCFRVKNYGTVKIADITIYNRFGKLVFHSANVNDCWDGTYKGNPVDPDNYVYYIKTFNDCGANTKKGNLVLIR